MKIWIDLTNSPHVNFFDHFVRDLSETNKLIITCRPLANTIELLKLKNIEFTIVGRHYGQNKVKKVIGFAVRVLQLLWFLRFKKVDVAISHSSFYSPIVSWVLGIRCIYLNDNEYADGNRISFIFADKIMVPEYLNIDKVVKQGARRNKIITYPGVKEGVYLWKYKIKKENKKSDRDIIYLRPEPWTAQYYKGKRNFIDNFLLEIKNDYKIILLPRGDEQKIHYKKGKFRGVRVQDKTITLEDIIKNCELFIGAGGTMTRELAVCGVPTISIYQDELLDVDKYLIKEGQMTHINEINTKFLKKYIYKQKIGKPNKGLLAKGKDAYNLIYQTIVCNNLK